MRFGDRCARSSSPPRRWKEGFFAPRDDVAGGTWLGVNDHGVFVGITNRYLGGRDTTRASRGELVVRATSSRRSPSVAASMRSPSGASAPVTIASASRGFHAAWARGDLEKLLTEHDAADPLAATCVHFPPLNYGTRSAMVLERAAGTWSLRWAEGPPCVTPFHAVAVSGSEKTR